MTTPEPFAPDFTRTTDIFVSRNGVNLTFVGIDERKEDRIQVHMKCCYGDVYYDRNGNQCLGDPTWQIIAQHAQRPAEGVREEGVGPPQRTCPPDMIKSDHLPAPVAAEQGRAVKRWKMHVDDDGQTVGYEMRESQYGDYVRLSDYDALRSRLTALEASAAAMREALQWAIDRVDLSDLYSMTPSRAFENDMRELVQRARVALSSAPSTLTAEREALRRAAVEVRKFILEYRNAHAAIPTDVQGELIAELTAALGDGGSQ